MVFLRTCFIIDGYVDLWLQQQLTNHYIGLFKNRPKSSLLKRADEVVLVLYAIPLSSNVGSCATAVGERHGHFSWKVPGDTWHGRRRRSVAFAMYLPLDLLSVWTPSAVHNDKEIAGTYVAIPWVDILNCCLIGSIYLQTYMYTQSAPVAFRSHYTSQSRFFFLILLLSLPRSSTRTCVQSIYMKGSSHAVQQIYTYISEQPSDGVYKASHTSGGKWRSQPACNVCTWFHRHDGARCDIFNYIITGSGIVVEETRAATAAWKKKNLLQLSHIHVENPPISDYCAISTRRYTKLK